MYLYFPNPDHKLCFWKEKYLKDGEAKRKPTVLFFVANFQAQTASFRLLLEAVEDINYCKEHGARVEAIIIDPATGR